MNITLVRHPQTEANKAHVIYGTTDYEYTQKGHNQVEWVKEYMTLNYAMNKEFDAHKERYHVVSSPRKRAFNLALEIGKALEIEVEENQDIREMNFGIFEGLTVEEAKTRYPDEYFNFQYHFDTTAIPKGESYDAFQKRIDHFVEFLGTLHQKEVYDEIIVVTHGGVIRDLLELLLELEPGDSWKFSISNGCIIKLKFKNGGFMLRELIANKF